MKIRQATNNPNTFIPSHRASINARSLFQYHHSKDSEAQQLKIGQSYVLKPVEPIGRLASKSVVDGGSVVSALHCGPADGAYLYSIHKIGTVGSSSSSSGPTSSTSAAYGDGGDAEWEELLRAYQGGHRNRKTIRRRNDRKRTTRKYRVLPKKSCLRKRSGSEDAVYHGE